MTDIREDEEPIEGADDLPDDTRDGDVGGAEDDPTADHEPTEEDA